MDAPFYRADRINKVFWLYITLFIVYVTNPVHAQTRLSGRIGGGTTFIADGNPYIVEKDITIPEDQDVVIGKGCSFFFMPFSGIIVEGSLKVAGTPDEPVLFTSINDSLSPQPPQQLANPFDWNGIFIMQNAGSVELSNFTLSYSVYGIKSQKAAITIKNGTFRQNGQYHCTINETVKQVADGIPFTYTTHAIVFDPNGAASGKVPVDTQRYNEGTIVKVPGNSGNLVNPRHVFAGWNSSFDGKGDDYAEGSTFIIGGSDALLYAKWLDSGEKGARSAATMEAGRQQGFGEKFVPYIVGGTGFVCGGVSLYFLKEWLDGKDEYNATVYTKERERLGDEGKVSSAIFISTGALSVAAITTGIILYLRNNPMKGRMAVTPLFSPRTVGAVVMVKM